MGGSPAPRRGATTRFGVILIAILVTTTLLLPLGTPAATTGDPAGGVVPDPAPNGIRILEDVGPDGFILGWNPVSGAPVYRPASGVTAGNGTAEDPFIVEDVMLTRIYVAGTTMHVVFRNVTVAPVAPEEVWITGGAGVVTIVEAANVSLVDSAILADDHAYGVRTRSTDGVTVEDTLIQSRKNLWTSSLWGGYDRNLTIRGIEGTNVVLYAQEDCVIEGNYLKHEWEIPPYSMWTPYSILIEDATRCRISGNTLTGMRSGVELRMSQDVVITGNSFRDLPEGYYGGGGVGIDVVKSPGTEVTANRLANINYGIVSYNSPGAVLAGNHVTDAIRSGIFAGSSPDTIIRDNRILHVENGVIVGGSNNVAVTGNTVRDAAVAGVALIRADDATVTRNTVREAGQEGVLVDESLGVTVTRNNIHGNGVGLRATGDVHGGPVAATLNWWGCVDGPDHVACDDVKGPVDADPWATEPIPDAGAE